jgi:hypothetical protein
MDDERNIEARDSQIGGIGDGWKVEGGIHFHASPTPIPLQRPPRAEHFTDREQELQRLLDELRPGQVATLCGPGGIGKTALAAEAVWTLAPDNEPPERFPDGILFHNFYQEPQAAVALEAFARAYGEEPRPTSRNAAMCALAGKQALLILDGTEDADDLRKVLDVRGGCGVLITSRARRDAPAERQDVEPLEAKDAVGLLRKWGGDRAADDRAAARICELTGYLPLAVRLAGRFLDETGETAAEYVEWLEETPLEALDHGDRRMESVDVLLEKSLEQVSDDACRVLGVVGLLALAPFDRDPIAAALDPSDHHLHKPLGELVSYGLLSREGDRYEVSHALVHTYARKRVEPEDGTVTRLAAYYSALAREQQERGVPGYRRLDVERGHLMRVLRTCAEREEWEAVRSLVWAAEGYLNIGGYWTERIQTLEMGVNAVQALSNRQDEGTLLGKLGNACHWLGQVEEAIDYHEQGLAIAREIGHRQGEGNRLGNLGNAYYRLGETRQARSAWREDCHLLEPIQEQTYPAYNLACAKLGLAVSDDGWREGKARKKLLAPVLAAFRAALDTSAAPGMIRDFLREHVYPLQEMGVEGLKPVVQLLEDALTEESE